MNEPRCIRYFKVKEKAEIARDILINEGFEAYVTEDKFYDIALRELGMTSRFRLYVERADIEVIAKVLQEKMKSKTNSS